MSAAPVPWSFWLADADRSTGWTNHGYVMQLVCRGHGALPAAAWDDAKSRGAVPEDLPLPARVIAIRDDAGHEFLVA